MSPAPPKSSMSEEFFASAANVLMTLSIVVKVSCGFPSKVRNRDKTVRCAASYDAQNQSNDSVASSCNRNEIMNTRQTMKVTAMNMLHRATTYMQLAEYII